MAQKNTGFFSSSVLLTMIKIGLFACLFMPLIVNGGFIFPYIFPKQAFFQIIVEIILGLYAILALRDPQFRPRSSKFMWALSAYLLVMVLSSVFGVNTYHSFWSNYERMAGVIAWWHYFAFLFVAVNVFKTRDDWYQFFDFSIIASVLQAFYGLGQLGGIFARSGGVRIDGTIGNASFFAGYMLINALFALWLFGEKRALSWRLFYVGAIILQMLTLYQSQTRGAMLALLLSLVVMAGFFIFAPRRALPELPFKKPKQLKKYVIGALILFLLAAGLIWRFRQSDFVAKHPTLFRVANISISENTSQTRLMAWRMSLKGFTERPIFGWGPENYYVVFNKFYNPYLYPVESWFDRSHNAYLDVLVNTGVVGFAAYLAVFIMAFWYLWRAWLKEKISYLTAVIFSVILFAYGVQNFFVFDTQVTLLMIFLIFAFIAYLSFLTEGPKGDPGRPWPINLGVLTAIVLSVVGCVYFINIKPGLASRHGIQAMIYSQQGQLEPTLQEFRRAYELGTFGLPEVALRAYDLAFGVLTNSSGNVSVEDKKKIFEVASEGLRKALEKEPLNARVIMIASNLYLVASAQLNANYLSEADVLLAQALEQSPTRQELYFYLAQLRSFQNRTDEVLPAMQKAVQLNDSVAVSHWNYGSMAISLGQVELGKAEIKKAVQLGHSYEPGDIKFLINAYSRNKIWPEVIALYDEWIAKYPADPTPYANLAITYLEIGDKVKAKEAALKAAEINPAIKPQVEEFIKNSGL